MAALSEIKAAKPDTPANSVRPKRARSLAFRLFVAAAAWVVVVLAVAGVLLTSYYQAETERGFDERLHVYLKTLVADLATRDVGDRPLAAGLGEPEFELALSGWYWQVSRVDPRADTDTHPDTNASRSLFNASLPTLEALGVPEREEGLREGYVTGPDGRSLRAVERVIDLGEDGRYLITVTGPADEIQNAISGFKRALVLTFGLLGIGLVGSTVLQVRFGLEPLKRMSLALAAMRAGRAETLPPDLPAEIRPLARELDALVVSNHQIVERARTHAGNLAHALKTPLSVITNEASALRDAETGSKLREQAELMRRQIDYHLQRARIAAAVSVVGTVVDVPPVVDGLVRVMGKVHRTRDLDIEVAMEGSPRFRGEKQDLEEMIGNLVDNACKWAATSVDVRAGTVERDGRATLHVTIDDDGPGLSPEKRAEAGRRGRRLDETVPGTGLGLSIVSDLVALYGGRLELEDAPKGGLRAALELPAAA